MYREIPIASTVQRRRKLEVGQSIDRFLLDNFHVPYELFENGHNAKKLGGTWVSFYQTSPPPKSRVLSLELRS